MTFLEPCQEFFFRQFIPLSLRRTVPPGPV
jgi:hypothetical protein